MTLNNGSILSYNLGAINGTANPLSSPTSDNVWLNAGTLTLTASSTDTLNITSLSGFGPGTYPLIETTGTIPSSLSGITFNVNGPLKYLYSVSLAPASGTVSASNPNALDLTVVTNPNPALTWVGAPGNGTWNTTSGNTPWEFTGGGGSAAYSDGANLTFDSTPATNSAITIPSNVAPGSMVFNNNAGANYTFSGAGAITGTLGFTKGNTGTVEFDNANTFSGTVNVTAGTVVVAQAGRWRTVRSWSAPTVR